MGPIVAAAPAPAYDASMPPSPTATRSPRPRASWSTARTCSMRSLADGRRGPGRRAHRPAAGVDPGDRRDRARLRRPGRARPAQRADRGGLTVRYSGPRTADAVILAMVDEVRLVDGADGTAALLVVTDDRELRYGSADRGARERPGLHGCIGRLDRRSRLASPSIGNSRPPRPCQAAVAAHPSDGDPDEPTGSDGSPAAARRRSAATRGGAEGSAKGGRPTR